MRPAPQDVQKALEHAKRRAITRDFSEDKLALLVLAAALSSPPPDSAMREALRLRGLLERWLEFLPSESECLDYASLNDGRVSESGLLAQQIRAALASPTTSEGAGSLAVEGRWRHSNGYLFCGSMRIARMDFDTNPTGVVKQDTFDAIAAAMNGNGAEPDYWLNPSGSVISAQAKKDFGKDFPGHILPLFGAPSPSSSEHLHFTPDEGSGQ